MRALIGFSSSLAAFTITLSDLEQIVRVTSAVVGLAIGVVTLVQMIRHRRHRKTRTGHGFADD